MNNRKEKRILNENVLESLFTICRLSGRSFASLIDSYVANRRFALEDLPAIWRERYTVCHNAVGGLAVRPIGLREANAFIARYHRHHQAVQGGKFSIAVVDTVEMQGVAIVGRPVARHLDDGWTAEVTRLATDGFPHAASMLLGATRRIAKSMGYRRILTYTLESETGVSLRAAGWKFVGRAGGGT